MNYKTVIEWVEDTIYSIKYDLKRLYKAIKWVPFLYNNNFDDYGSLMNIMEYKLSQMKTAFENDDRYIRDKKFIKKLSVAIELLKRYDDEFIWFHHDRCTKLFGELDFIPIEGKEKLYELKRSSYKDNKLNKLEERFNRHLRKLDIAYTKDREELLRKIFSRHMKRWWI